MDDAFANEPIPVDELPQLRQEWFVPVDPRYLRASLAAMAIGALVVAAVGGVIATQSDRPRVALAVTGGVLALIALRAVINTLEVRRLAYQVRTHDLSMRSGVITHRTASLPFARVQHVRIHRGAIERALGLATLQVSSAGPNITIPGLADADAQRIKQLVTERAGMIVEEDDDGEIAGAGPPPPAPTTPLPAPPTAAPLTSPPPAPPTAPPTSPPPA